MYTVNYNSNCVNCNVTTIYVDFFLHDTGVCRFKIKKSTEFNNTKDIRSKLK